jgi:hypothetical protein
LSFDKGAKVIQWDKDFFLRCGTIHDMKISLFTNFKFAIQRNLVHTMSLIITVNFQDV